MDYGLGAVFGCPAHDQRNLDFKKKNNLKVTPVVRLEKDKNLILKMMLILEKVIFLIQIF